MSHPQDLDRLVQGAEELWRDYEFSAVKAWKEKTGGLAVGFLPIYAPRELLHAQNVLPVGILGGGADLEIIRGDAYYQSYICHIPRSTIELGLNGSLDCLDGVLFPAICDVIRNLSGMWKMLFPDKLVRYIDVPQDYRPEIGGAFYRRELEELSEQLVKKGAAPYDPKHLRRSLELYNENSREVRRLYKLRSDEPWKIPTYELYSILRAGLVLPVEAHTEMLQSYQALVRKQNDRAPLDQARVVLSGPFCEQPPLGLLKTLERAGCYIVDDDLIQIHRWFREEIPTDGDPMANLVQSFLSNVIESPTRYIDQEEKGADLTRRVRENAAEGVLFAAPSFCDPALLDQPMVTRVMDEQGIPWTAFKYAENNGQFQVIREQAGTFADSIKLWSGVS